MSERHLLWLAATSLIGLILWTLAWELWLAPLRPGGSLLALKAVILLLPLRGVLAGKRYTYQWASMFILFFFGEGVMRAWSDIDPTSRLMAWGEIVWCTVFFVTAIYYAKATHHSQPRRTLS